MRSHGDRYVPEAAENRPVRVEEIPSEATHELRRQVLRDGRADANVTFPEDSRPGCFHLGVRDAGNPGAILAVGSFSPEPAATRPGRPAVRLRGMAVDPAHQGMGLGRVLLMSAVQRLREAGIAVLWCNARDTAAGFYARFGFEVVGEGFVPPESGLPHHMMVKDLDRDEVS